MLFLEILELLGTYNIGLSQVGGDPLLIPRSRNRPQPIKIVVLGEGGVGKTTLAEIFCNNSFFGKTTLTTQTIGVQFHSKIIKMNEKIWKMQIWDLGGQRRFREMGVFQKYCKGAHGAVLCFDLSDLETLVMIPNWLQILPQNIPTVLIGTKCDKVEGYNAQILKEDVLPFLRKCSSEIYVQTSAANPDSIISAFNSLLELILDSFEKEYENNALTPQNVRNYSFLQS